MIRASCGAALFGVPLLYTMELWWRGSQATPLLNLSLVIGLVLVAAVLDRTAAFRFSEDRSWFASLVDGVEIVAISVVVAAIILVVIGEIDLTTRWRESASKVIAQLLPLVIGASIANEVFGSSSGQNGEPSDSGDLANGSRALLTTIGPAFLGSVVVALAIAPTDEVIIIAGRARLGHLLALIAVSLLVSHATVFSADFAGSVGLRRPTFGSELAHTGIAYVTAIVASAVMLGLYARIGGVSSLTAWSRVVALGFPASVGAAAGRLAV